jgi:hypothetical protein
MSKLEREMRQLEGKLCAIYILADKIKHESPNRAVVGIRKPNQRRQLRLSDHGLYPRGHGRSGAFSA